MRDKKQRNRWLYGFVKSLVILLLGQMPWLFSKGLPEKMLSYILLQLVMLGVGTLIFGYIDLYYQRSLDKTDV